MLQDNRLLVASSTTLLMMTFMAPQAVSQTPSFDCAAATTTVEQFICSDAELASLDVELLQIYRRVAAASADKDGLKKSQRIWMKQRNACDTVECVGEAYRNRIAALSQMVAGSADEPSTPAPSPPAGPENASADAVKKAEEDAKRRIEAANKAAAEAEQRAQNLIRKKTEEAEKALQEAQEKAKAEAEQKAKDEALAQRRDAEVKLATSVKSGGLEGYGVVLFPIEGKPLCYVAGSEGAGWLGAVGFGEDRDWRAEFARRLPSVKEEPTFATITDLRKYVSLEDLISNLHRGDCSMVFGSSDDLKTVIVNAEVQKIAFEMIPRWFSTADFETTINVIKSQEAEEKRRAEEKAAQLAKDQQRLKEEAERQAAQQKAAAEEQAAAQAEAERQHPFTMIMTCSGGRVPVVACFVENRDTAAGSLSITSDGRETAFSKVSLYQQMGIQEYRQPLSERFTIIAQSNSTSYGVLEIVVVDSSGAVVAQQQASDYGVIRIRN